MCAFVLILAYPSGLRLVQLTGAAGSVMQTARGARIVQPCGRIGVKPAVYSMPCAEHNSMDPCHLPMIGKRSTLLYHLIINWMSANTPSKAAVADAYP